MRNRSIRQPRLGRKRDSQIEDDDNGVARASMAMMVVVASDDVATHRVNMMMADDRVLSLIDV